MDPKAIIRSGANSLKSDDLRSSPTNERSPSGTRQSTGPAISISTADSQAKGTRQNDEEDGGKVECSHNKSTQSSAIAQSTIKTCLSVAKETFDL